ncbi:hypothetical protein A0H81_02430 [Grifola frondosa]|uniref:Uncharacterized protein n=1 Tax=Grifola frondosa TaxID=5627 RepID=A0A1C7MNE3_GRIFR|nr:hypothetical protein A0H81_02430 [Grifola frondosa]
MSRAPYFPQHPWGSASSPLPYSENRLGEAYHTSHWQPHIVYAPILVAAPMPALGSPYQLHGVPGWAQQPWYAGPATYQNTHRRASRPPSIAYWSTELSDNPLGLENVHIRAGPSTAADTGDEREAPHVQNVPADSASVAAETHGPPVSTVPISAPIISATHGNTANVDDGEGTQSTLMQTTMIDDRPESSKGRHFHTVWVAFSNLFARIAAVLRFH